MLNNLGTALAHVKASVRELPPYTLRHTRPRIKLNQNESPYDLPEALKAEVCARLAVRPWSRYPPFVPTEFIASVAEAQRWDPDGVLVGSGSNDLIQALLAVTVGPGVSVVISEPTFTLYRLMTRVGEGRVASVPLTNDLAFDVPAIIRRARAERAAVIVLCTPNNPTGSALSTAEVRKIHDETDGLVVVDQAYVEFGGDDARPLLDGRPRLLLLRTFSKALAMAGLRAGYLLGDPALAFEIAKAKLPYNVNFVTETAASVVLRNREMLDAQIERIRTMRDRLREELAALPGVRVFPSAANFVLFRVATEPVDHAELSRRLMDDFGILVRDVSGYPMLDGCLRVTAGTAEETDIFLDATRHILKGAE